MVKITVVIFLLGLISPSNSLAEANTHLDNAKSYQINRNYESAIQEYILELHDHPNNSKVHSELGYCYLLKHNEMVEQNKKNTSIKQHKELYLEQVDFEDEGSKEYLNKAIQEGEKAVKLDDSSWIAHFMLGNTYYYKNMFKKTENELHKSINLTPNVASYVLLSRVYEDTERFPLAIEAMKKALSIYPKDNLARWYLAKIYIKANMKNEAMGEYNILKSKNSPFAKLVGESLGIIAPQGTQDLGTVNYEPPYQ